MALDLSSFTAPSPEAFGPESASFWRCRLSSSDGGDLLEEVANPLLIVRFVNR